MEKRLGFLDGLKVAAMLLVFNIHFFNAYYCGVYTLDPASFHTRHGVEWWIGATPLNIIYAGKVGARLFLTVSAFLLVWGYLQKGNPGKLLLTPVTKYLRLVGPIVVVNLLICFLMSAGAYRNLQAAELAGSYETFGVYNQFEPEVFQAFQEGAWGCFWFGENRYNGPLWFIQYEFLGCILLAALLYVTGRWKTIYRLAVYLMLALLLIRTDYLCMVLGGLVAEIYAGESKNREKGTGQRSCVDRLWAWCGKLFGCAPAMWILFLCCLFLMTYPSLGKTEGTIYAWLPPKVLFYYNIALPGFLLAILYLRPVQKLLDKRIFRWFHGISYCFYLVHFPMLCTVSAAFFVSMYGKLSYHVLAAFTYLLTFLASGFLAWGLQKCVDGPMQRLVRRLTKRFVY